MIACTSAGLYTTLEHSTISVELCDVGPRDGLQSDPRALAPVLRAELAARLSAAGLPRVEVASFVRDDRVPQMAGAEDVVAALPAGAATAWSGLVLNERGYDRALACGLRRVNYTLPATEAFAERNQATTVAAARATGARLGSRAAADGVRLSITLAVAFGCPFEGAVDPGHVVDLAEEMAAAGAAEVVLADTIGVAVPTHVRLLLGRVAGLDAALGCHFHDTRNTGVVNAVAAIETGVDVLDASIGGTGGCPFAPGAGGNVATEDLVYTLEGMGVATGVDLDELLRCSAWLAARLEHPVPAALSRAGRPLAHV